MNNLPVDNLLTTDLFAELGINALPEEQKKKMTEQVMQTLQGRIMLAIMALLTEEDTKVFKQLLDEQKDIDTFLLQRIPFFEVMVADVVAQFKKDMLDLMQSVKGRQ